MLKNAETPTVTLSQSLVHHFNYGKNNFTGLTGPYDKVHYQVSEVWWLINRHSKVGGLNPSVGNHFLVIRFQIYVIYDMSYNNMIMT